MTIRETRADPSGRKAQLLLHAMEYTDSAILITDRDGIIEYSNASFSSMFNIDKQDLIGSSINELQNIANNKRYHIGMREFQQHAWQAISQAESWQGKLLNSDQDDSACTVLMSVNPIYDQTHQNISHFVVTQRDISEQQAMEDRFHEAQKMEAVGTLAGGIAHDFNNILAGIMMNTYLIQQHINQGKSIQNGLQVINSSCEKASELIKQMLTFARKDRVSFEPLSLTTAFQQALALARLNVPANIQLQCDFPSDTLFSRGSIVQIEQMLINLINNARDALEGTEQPCIQLRLEKLSLNKATATTDLSAGDYAHLIIADNGEGMQDTSKIFDPFYTSKEQGKGTGLGLAMVYGSVQRHHGHIVVESKSNQGSIFHIYLPLITDQQTIIEPTTEHQLIAGQSQWLLLADDEDFVRESMYDVLSQLGFNVLTANNGQQAIEIFQQHQKKIALVILDIIMPHTGGFEAAKSMRAMQANLPIIFATAYANSNILNLELKQFKNSIVLSKPFQIADLSTEINKLLQANEPPEDPLVLKHQEVYPRNKSTKNNSN